MGERSYLSERQYRNDETKDISKEKQEYWQNILGAETVSRLQKENGKFDSYLREKSYVSSGLEIQADGLLYYLRDSFPEKKSWRFDEKEKKHLLFPEFYECIASYCIQKFRKELQRDFGEGNSLERDLVLYLVSQLQNICTRTLIVEMRVCKRKGQLYGNDVEEEYEYFCMQILTKQDAMSGMLERYPVLCRCIEECVACAIQYFKEIIGNYQKEYQQLVDALNHKTPLGDICHIRSGSGDVHNGGRQVLKVSFATGMELLYKPHSMINERKFYEILNWISAGAHITQRDYDFITYGDHSWCSIIDYRSCHKKDELKRYYKRLGIQLFLAYVLGTQDLHFENIIASGEYPVLIDLESLVNVPVKGKSIIEGKIGAQLKQSVLQTGILPVYSWNADGKGMNNSGISGGRVENCPFKVPIIKRPRTSEMSITYDCPTSETGKNLAMLDGNYAPASDYEEELMDGFAKGYQYTLDYMDSFLEHVSGLTDVTSRYIICDTQRYTMVLASSYHPSLLMDGANREIYLSSMWKGRKDGEIKLLPQEVMNPGLLSGYGGIIYYFLR